MIDLIEKLNVIAAQADASDARIIKAAINRIKELEAKMIHYESDITDWRGSVETQMRRRRDDRWIAAPMEEGFIYHPRGQVHDYMEYSEDLELQEMASPANHHSIDV